MMTRAFKRSSLWSCIVALVMAAQFAFAFHHLQHPLIPDASAQSDECALCHGVSSSAPLPDLLVVTAPSHYVVVYAGIPEAPVYLAAPRIGFRARAPPISVSL